MKISVITVCYNSEKYIRDAIESVLSQDYESFEYIIVDGQSRDQTMSIVNSYKGAITKVVSEPDKGIYDAMNKGISLATGDYIAFLNSDDIYTNKHVLSSVAQELKRVPVDSLYANINYVKTDDVSSIIRKWRTGSLEKHSFKNGWHPAHPTFIVRKDIYDKLGKFDLYFSLAADFELMLRFLECHKVSYVYLDKVLIHMRLGGATSSGVKNSIKQNIECYNAFKKNHLKVSILYPLWRILPKLKQYM